MKTQRDLVDALGRKTIASHIGCEVHTISMHLGRGVFPGSWFWPLKELAAERGLGEPPHGLFRWARPKASSE